MRTKLRDRRKQRLFTQEELAEQVGVSPVTVRRWETGQLPQPIHLRRLCDVLEATPLELGFTPENDAVKRRQFLKRGLMLGAGGIVDQERLTAALVHPSQVNRRLLDDLAGITRAYSSQAQVVTPRILLGEMSGHLARLHWLAQGSFPEATRRHLQRLASEAAVMAGRLAFWSDNRGLATDHFHQAEALGREAHEPQLEAVAIAFRADLHSGVPYLGTMGGNTRVALTLFDRAASLDGPDWPPVLRAWMVGCRAEEHAALGHDLESDRDMEAAHRAIAVTGVVHNPALDVASLDIVTTTAGLAGFIGACALALERHQEAAAIFKQGLDEAVSVGRLSGLAAVRALEEELEEACRLLTEALELAIQRDLPTRLKRVEGVRARYLSRWPEYPAVQEFDERFRLAVAS